MTSVQRVEQSDKTHPIRWSIFEMERLKVSILVVVAGGKEELGVPEEQEEEGKQVCTLISIKGFDWREVSLGRAGRHGISIVIRLSKRNDNSVKKPPPTGDIEFSGIFQRGFSGVVPLDGTVGVI